MELVLNTFGTSLVKTNDALQVVHYDIENNKIRNYIAKYLERKGCIRVQKSIFIAESARKKFKIYLYCRISP